MNKIENQTRSHPVTSLSVFFPCYNEKESICALTEKTVSVAGGICDDYEIILVDDGSSDGTAELADELAEKYPAVRVIHHPVNKGYGAALQSGFRAATKAFFPTVTGESKLALHPMKAPSSTVVWCFSNPS